MPARDPDEMLVVLFRLTALKNEAKSLAAGRDIFDDVEICEIRMPGSRDVKVFPATSFSRWIEDGYGTPQYKQSYAERFSHQYRQFKASAAQTKSGTPLDALPFLTDGRRAELRAQHVYTLEQLAEIEGAELKNLGPNGREFKNKAIEFIEQSKAVAPTRQMEAELEALRARNTILEEDVITLRSAKQRAEAEFEDMSDEQLREYIAANTGKPPIGNLPRKTLKRMAVEATAKAA